MPGAWEKWATSHQPLHAARLSAFLTGHDATVRAAGFQLLKFADQGAAAAAVEAATKEKAKAEPPVSIYAHQDYFIASATFAGERPGYSFKNGDRGMGYYREAAARPAVATATGAASGAANAISIDDVTVEDNWGVVRLPRGCQDLIVKVAQSEFYDYLAPLGPTAAMGHKPDGAFDAAVLLELKPLNFVMP